jgi:hypothetical protein
MLVGILDLVIFEGLRRTTARIDEFEVYRSRSLRNCSDCRPDGRRSGVAPPLARCDGVWGSSELKGDPVSSLGSMVRWSQKRVVAIGVIAGMCFSGTMVWSASSASFSGYTTNPLNTWSTGTVSMTDDDTGIDNLSGTALFSASGLYPTNTLTRCIRVTYTGTVAATVHLYSSAVSDSTPSLLQWINMTITEGTGTANFANSPDCSNFTADAGNSVLYNNLTLEPSTGFAAKTTWATGVYNTTTPWTPSGTATKVYKFVYTLNTSAPDTVQGKTATIGFRWEAKTP